MPGGERIFINGDEVLTATELHNLKQAIYDHLPVFEGSYQIERMPGNLSPSARVFKLAGGDNVFVVRILDRERYLKESTYEIELSRTLSDQGIFPPVYHAAVATGIVIMKFIKEIPIPLGQPEKTQAALVALAKKIRVIHALPVREKPASLLPSNLQKERLAATYARAATHEAYQIFLQGVEYLNQLSVFINPTAFCHNNLHRYNILHSDAGSYIIDWETAGAGEPFLDLANFFTLARFSTEQETAFLAFYLEREPSSLELAKLKIMMQISFLRYALGLFATISLNDVSLDSLNFDTIPVITDPSFKRSMSCAQDTFIYCFAILKEVFVAMRSPSFLEDLRLVSAAQTLPETFFRHRLFPISNPKAVERAQLALGPYLSESAAPPTIEPLSGGSEQATNYKVHLSGAPVALRVYSETTTPQQFRHETVLYQHAATIGIGPAVAFLDDTNLSLATSFVETPTAGWQHTLTTDQLTQLAQQIRKLHNTPFDMVTPQQTCTGLPLTSLTAAERITEEAAFTALSPIITTYKRLLALLKPEVLSHNRLSRGNILFDGERFQFIDWENATLNDRLYDPAFLSCYFFLSPDQEKILLTTYLGHDITRTEEQKFYLVKLLVLCHLAIVNITTCNDMEFLASIPRVAPEQRYFNYNGKAKHLLNLQADFGKYVIYQLISNEIQFIMTTGKFLVCEKNLLKTLKGRGSLSFSDLPLLAQRSFFSHLPRKELARLSGVSKDWARASLSLADDDLLTVAGIEAIPLTTRPNVLTALRATFIPYKKQHTAIDTMLAPQIAASITPFTDGLSPWANTCKLIINDNPFVIRLMSVEPDPICVKLEILIMRLFSAIGVSPKIHYASDASGVIIMDYVDATPAWHQEITPEVLTQLGLLFNQMNDVGVSSAKKPPFFPNRRLQQMYNRVYKLCREDLATDNRFGLFREMLTELDQLRPLCEALTEHTICHHDSHVWNLLQHKTTRSFSAIDFEFSQSGDRLFDLGSLVVFMRLNKKAEIDLLRSFFGRNPTEHEQNKYHLFKQYAWLHYIVMSLGICKGMDFTITAAEIDELPPYNEFKHTTVLSTPLDPYSDVGHYKFAIMFIKQAKIDGAGDEYRAAVDFFCPAARTTLEML